MPYYNSEFLFAIQLTEKLSGLMSEFIRFRGGAPLSLKSEMCSLMGRRFPKSEAAPRAEQEMTVTG